MEINVQFNSSVSGLIYNTQSNALKTQSSEENNQSSTYTDQVSLTAQATAAQNETGQPLSDAELEYLYSSYLQLGDESELYGRIGSLVDDMSGEDRLNFLATLAQAGDELENVVLTAENLEESDRSLFLRTSVRMRSGDDLSNLIEVVKKTQGQTRSGFLEMADQLNRSLESIKADELENFIAAAAGSPETVSELTSKTIELGDEENNRENFLAAAAGSGEELADLIAVTDTLKQIGLSGFLSTASRAGEGLSNLIRLTPTLNNGKALELFNTASVLEDKDLENYLLASRGEKETLSKLSAVTSDLAGAEQSQFLELAADVTGSLAPLLGIVPKLDSESGDLGSFLTAALKTGENLSGFMDMVQGVSDTDRTQTLSFAADLSLFDLASFITATRKNDPGDLVSTAGELSGKDKSYFLYASSLTRDAQGLIAQMDGLTDNEKSAFLFRAANTDPDSDSEQGLDGFLNDLDGMGEQERAAYLASERTRIKAESGEKAQYVYLNAAFDEPTIDAMLGADSRMDDMLKDIDELDNDQRAVFLSVAATAGEELVPDILDVVDKLGKEEAQTFMDFSQTLNSKDLANYVGAAQTALDGPDVGNTLFERITDMAKELSGAMREDFLNAAANTGNALNGFMDLTEKLGGAQRGNFLIAADNIADSPGGEKWMADFVQGTQNLIDRNKSGFLGTAAAFGKNAGDILHEDSMAGTSGLSSVDSYLKSAVWITNYGRDNSVKEDWITSFL